MNCLSRAWLPASFVRHLGRHRRIRQQWRRRRRFRGFLTTWNTIIQPADDPQRDRLPATNAFELLWRTQSICNNPALEVAAAAFELPVEKGRQHHRSR